MTNTSSMDKVRDLSNRKLGPGAFDTLTPFQQETLARYHEQVRIIASAANEISAIGLEMAENGYVESGSLMLDRYEAIRKVFSGKA